MSKLCLGKYIQEKIYQFVSRVSLYRKVCLLTKDTKTEIESYSNNVAKGRQSTEVISVARAYVIRLRVYHDDNWQTVSDVCIYNDVTPLATVHWLVNTLYNKISN